MKRSRIREILANSRPVKYRSFEGVVCSHLKEWPVDIKEGWIVGISIDKNCWDGSCEITVLDRNELGMKVSIRRPWWKRLLLWLRRRNDLHLFEYPRYAVTPLLLKANTEKDRARRISLIMADGT